MLSAFLAALLAAGQTPEPVPPAPRPMPRGPAQPATGAARPELVRMPPFCSPTVSARTDLIFRGCFSNGDYPLEAYEAREQGVVGVRVEVAESGRATGCTITAPSGSATLDRATCDLLQRRIVAAFAFVDGRQEATTLTGRVAWQLPTAPPRDTRTPYVSYFSSDDYPAPALRANAQGAVAFTLQVSAEGRVTACEVTRSSGTPVLDEATCRIMQRRARYFPARDAEGRQVPGTDTDGRIIWRLPEE